MSVDFRLDGSDVVVDDEGSSLLDALRGELGVTSVKDGCSPQGQCGCCTVLVDGAARVACVTPVTRVRGRDVTTVDGVTDAAGWAQAMASTGGSQCGFCTPGIIVRLAALDPAVRADRTAVDKALLAHLCRCTGWQTIREACALMAATDVDTDTGVASDTVGDTAGEPAGTGPAEQRAALEGRVPQLVGPTVALGRGGFADDGAPDDALFAVRDGAGDWIVGESLAELRRRAGTTQGRRTTAPPSWPVDLPDGDWATRLRTTWVEPAYLEPDSSWCAPGGEPASPLGNGGAFGGKVASEAPVVARRLAEAHGRPVRVLTAREDVVRYGPKRPPLAVGVDPSGSGLARVGRPADAADEEVLRRTIAAVAPSVAIEFVGLTGPPIGAAARGAGWAEVAAVLAVATEASVVRSPDGSAASAEIVDDGSIEVWVSCGDPLDRTVVRSYAIGAAHMALGMVRSEAITLDEGGRPLDLTIRSFGVLRAVDTPEIAVTVEPSSAAPVNGSDAVFAAVLAAAWRAAGTPPMIPAPT